MEKVGIRLNAFQYIYSHSESMEEYEKKLLEDCFDKLKTNHSLLEKKKPKVENINPGDILFIDNEKKRSLS